jgi:DNA-binding MarR family transcriptional regulator
VVDRREGAATDWSLAVHLLALYDDDGPTPTDLAGAVGIEQATMTRTLQRMERDGLVRREPDPHDRRSVRIRLTRRAREIEPEVKAAAGRINTAVLAALPDEERQRVLSSLGTLIDAAQAITDTSSHLVQGIRRAPSSRSAR